MSEKLTEGDGMFEVPGERLRELGEAEREAKRLASDLTQGREGHERMRLWAVRMEKQRNEALAENERLREALENILTHPLTPASRIARAALASQPPPRKPEEESRG